MAWNEPGGGKDPWGGGQGNGPPDLDEALKKLRERFGRFGGAGGGDGTGGPGFNFLPLVFGLLVAVWFFAGIYQVDEKERGIVLRFGEYLDTVTPGLHWNPPFIDTVTVVRVTEERQYQNSARDLMLTEDENIVDLQLAVQYNIADPKAFVLNVKDPEFSLQHATQSALRHVVGSSKLDQVISTGREQVAFEVKERIQQYLDNYQTGINVVKVNIKDAKPPAEVKAAYDDVIKAREDQERVINEAQSYANGVIPEARGKAQRIIEEARAYEAKVVAEAQGEADRFIELLVEYRKAPEVTRERLYLSAMQSLMNNSTKVMVDVKDGNNIFYLPLDKTLTPMPSDVDGASSNMSQAQISTLAEEIIRRLRSQSNQNQRKELR
ncbi:MAG: FtsH protease activity modulator HflK [Porticoccaceae bacterium]|nr:FtsH protease activity modulator HflK [Porticoccaceae bacterium]